jgi:hypothetical protein
MTMTGNFLGKTWELCTDVFSDAAAGRTKANETVAQQFLTTVDVELNRDGEPRTARQIDSGTQRQSKLHLVAKSWQYSGNVCSN